MATMHTSLGTVCYTDEGSGPPVVLLHAALHDRTDYAPVSEAVLDFIRANPDVITDSLDQLWSYDPTRFTYIKANWRNYMFHVNETAYFG